MQGPLYLLLVRLGIPATVAAAIVGALMLLGGCAGESVTIARAPNVTPSPTVVLAPAPGVTVPQK